jgi:hypothetical protein
MILKIVEPQSLFADKARTLPTNGPTRYARALASSTYTGTT